jgi:hypothetical protein
MVMTAMVAIVGEVVMASKWAWPSGDIVILSR